MSSTSPSASPAWTRLRSIVDVGAPPSAGRPCRGRRRGCSRRARRTPSSPSSATLSASEFDELPASFPGAATLHELSAIHGWVGLIFRTRSPYWSSTHGLSAVDMFVPYSTYWRCPALVPCARLNAEYSLFAYESNVYERRRNGTSWASASASAAASDSASPALAPRRRTGAEPASLGAAHRPPSPSDGRRGVTPAVGPRGNRIALSSPEQASRPSDAEPRARARRNGERTCACCLQGTRLARRAPRRNL